MKNLKGFLFLGTALAFFAVPLTRAQNSYKQTNLTANAAGVANNTDAQLSNPWGISFLPGDVFWIDGLAGLKLIMSVGAVGVNETST